MRVVSSLQAVLLLAVSFLCLIPSASAGSLTVKSPIANSANSGAVSVIASSSESVASHLEIWDNGNKLADVASTSVNTTYSLSVGSHVMTIMAVSSVGNILNSNIVVYKVADGAAANSLNIASPGAGSTSISAVRITASSNEGVASHLEIWDNGYKLGDVSATSVNQIYVLPTGAHVLTVMALTTAGAVLSKSSVNYTVASNCSTSSSAQCNLDQQGLDNSQMNCSPPEEKTWVANPCGPGIQGDGGLIPLSTGLYAAANSGTIPNLGNLTLNGKSLHLQEVQASQPSNVLFRGQSPNTFSTSSTDSHWTLEEYVYLPDPTAHQAFEMDAQASIQGIWSKFYTECAFNISNGTGYWAVFDTETGGWIFLNGKSQNGQTPPAVPCNRSQFSQPWANSGAPGFTGWHHIMWNFLRNSDGTVTFQTLTFDNTVTQVNFHPNSGSGGAVSNTGQFSALIQLDGVVNTNRAHDLVDAYVNQVSLTHTP